MREEKKIVYIYKYKKKETVTTCRAALIIFIMIALLIILLVHLVYKISEYCQKHPLDSLTAQDDAS